MWFILLLFQSFSVFAIDQASIRTLNSDADDYREHLLEMRRVPFAQAWIALQKKIELSDENIDRCLEGLEKDCGLAIDLLMKTLINSERAETTILLVERMPKSTAFRKDLLISLLKSYPQTKAYLKKEISSADLVKKKVPELHYRAWLKSLQKSENLKDSVFLVNGKEIKNLNDFRPEEGIYQWALISNTLRPLVMTSSWSQFASESLKENKPLFAGQCDDLQSLQPKSMGLINVEVFAKSNCYKVYSEYAQPLPYVHLGSVTDKKQIQSSKKTWLWTALAVVVAGAAYSLKDKNVSITSPSFQ